MTTISMSDSHDSETCALGLSGQPCTQCAAAKEYEAKHGKCCERCADADKQEREQIGESNLLEVVTRDLNWVRLHKVRDAILDVLDAGRSCGECSGHSWVFDPRDESDDESARRIDFAEAVVAQIEKSNETQNALLSEVAQLRAEALKGVCVYCGYIEQYESLEQKASEEGNAMRVAHIRQCEARPEKKLIAFSEQLIDGADKLRAALVLAALPYEALLMDQESRKWIAPEVWSAIEVAVTAARATGETTVEAGHVLITETDNATYQRLVDLLLEEDHEPAGSSLDADDILKQIIAERNNLRAATRTEGEGE